MSEGSILLVILDEAIHTGPEDKGRTLFEDWKKAEVKREAKNPVLFIAAIFVFDKIFVFLWKKRCFPFQLVVLDDLAEKAKCGNDNLKAKMVTNKMGKRAANSKYLLKVGSFTVNYFAYFLRILSKK